MTSQSKREGATKALSSAALKFAGGLPVAAPLAPGAEVFAFYRFLLAAPVMWLVVILRREERLENLFSVRLWLDPLVLVRVVSQGLAFTLFMVAIQETSFAEATVITSAYPVVTALLRAEERTTSLILLSLIASVGVTLVALDPGEGLSIAGKTLWALAALVAFALSHIYLRELRARRSWRTTELLVVINSWQCVAAVVMFAFVPNVASVATPVEFTLVALASLIQLAAQALFTDSRRSLGPTLASFFENSRTILAVLVPALLGWEAWLEPQQAVGVAILLLVLLAGLRLLKTSSQTSTPT